MNKAIQLIILCGLILLLVGLYSCDDPIPDEVEDLYPQEQIPWPSLADTPWPMVRHDPQGTNRSGEEGLNTVNGVSLVATDAYYESPAVLDSDNGLLRLGTDEHWTILEHFNVTYSYLDWRLPIDYDPEIVFAPTLASNNRIYIPGQRSIWALDMQTREVIWEYQNVDYTASNITIGLSGELYYFASDPLELICLNSDGSLRWSHENPVHTNLGPTPIVMSPGGEYIYFSSGEDITCLSTEGELIWQFPTEESWVGFLMIDNAGNIYFFANQLSSILCVTPLGQVRWQTTINSLGITRIHTTTAPTIDFGGNLYYSAKDTSGLVGVISLDNEGFGRWFRPVVTVADLVSDRNNHIYYGHTSYPNHFMGAISEDGDIVWEFELSNIHGRLANAPVITASGEVVYTLYGFNLHAIKLH